MWEFGNGSVISDRCLRRPFSVSRFSRNVEVAPRRSDRRRKSRRIGIPRCVRSCRRRSTGSSHGSARLPAAEPPVQIEVAHLDDLGRDPRLLVKSILKVSPRCRLRSIEDAASDTRRTSFPPGQAVSGWNVCSIAPQPDRRWSAARSVRPWKQWMSLEVDMRRHARKQAGETQLART